MFRVVWSKYGELDYTSKDFCNIIYDVSEHRLVYKTCNEVVHVLRCDFSSIFERIHSIVSSKEFQSEKPYNGNCGGDWYEFEYTLNGCKVKHEGYIYGLRLHEEIISLIVDCARKTLEDEQKLLQNKYIDKDGLHFGVVEDWVEDIIKSRRELEEDFLDFWSDIWTK